MGKIKIMLAGYVNYPNAQNINCDNIAKRLDKSKFEVHTLYLSGLPIDKKYYKEAGIILHRINLHRILNTITLKFALNQKYDIWYMPKADKVFRDWILKNKEKRLIVSSIEGVVVEEHLVGDSYWYKGFLIENAYDVFAISNCIADSVEKYYNKRTDVIPLGVKRREVTAEQKEDIKNIIWVGNVKANKRPIYLVKCAKNFPNLHFTMIGDGDMLEDVRDYIAKNNLTNVTLTERIPNKEVYTYMENSDLLLMTSEFEGLPKVMQEAAQCGVPSIYIANNYTVDFIESGVNGYAVYSREEMVEKLQHLLDNPQEYQQMSKKAKESIQAYTWINLIEKYEAWFIKKLEEYQKEGRS